MNAVLVIQRIFKTFFITATHTGMYSETFCTNDIQEVSIIFELSHYTIVNTAEKRDLCGFVL